MEKYLYRFHWDCSRSGDLEGLFVATEGEVNGAIGRYVHFGEVLGKHSDVYGTIDDGDIQKLDINSAAVEEVSKYLGETWSGFNPLHKIRWTCREREYQDEDSYFAETGDNSICLDCKEKQETGEEQ